MQTLDERPCAISTSSQNPISLCGPKLTICLSLESYQRLLCCTNIMGCKQQTLLPNVFLKTFSVGSVRTFTVKVIIKIGCGSLKTGILDFGGNNGPFGSKRLSYSTLQWYILIKWTLCELNVQLLLGQFHPVWLYYLIFYTCCTENIHVRKINIRDQSIFKNVFMLLNATRGFEHTVPKV